MSSARRISMAHDSFFADNQTLRTTLSLAHRSGTTARRIAVTDGLVAAHRLMLMGANVGRAIDRWRDPGFQDVELKEPVYIVAPPRSGTTFLHRLMCLDDRFAYLKLYHTIFPAISLYKTIDATAAADSALGGLLSRIVDAIESVAFGGWEDIHPLGFDRAEEDEGIFILTLLSPGMYLLAPEMDELERPAWVDRLEPETRQRLTALYRSTLKRVMYHEGQDRRFLGKTVLFPGRMQTVMEACPDARFIQLVRHPYKTVPSLVSMFRKPWAFFEPDIPDEGPETRRVAELAMDYYNELAEMRRTLDGDKMKTVQFDDLVDTPAATVEDIYEWLDIPVEDTFRRRLHGTLSAQGEHSSGHAYSLEQFGLSRETVYERLGDVFATYGFDR
jgi:hypothetical protein